MSPMSFTVLLATCTNLRFFESGSLPTHHTSPTLLSSHPCDQSQVLKASRAEMLCLLAFLPSYRSQTVPAQTHQRQPVQPKAYCRLSSLHLGALGGRRTEDSGMLNTSRLLVACSLASCILRRIQAAGTYTSDAHALSQCELAEIVACAAKERAMARLS